jgi:serine/threonine protein kinase
MSGDSGNCTKPELEHSNSTPSPGENNQDKTTRMTDVQISHQALSDGRFEIIRLIGAGGMGNVYEARDLSCGRVVALKTLTKLSPNSLERFKQEAKLLAQLNQHPNIVKPFSLALHDGGLCLVSEFLDGKDLAQELKDRSTPMPLERALRIFRQIADALEFQEDQKIIHRDLKPSNVFLVHENDQDDVVKIIDYGIAKCIDAGQGDQALTKAGMTPGTPTYMSPEQCEGKRQLDIRSDIYSFGCLMFETLTGQPPLEGDSLFATLSLHMHERAPLLSEAMQGNAVPLAMERLIAKCLENEPENRYQSAKELREALAAIEMKATTVMRISSSVSPNLLIPRIRKRLAVRTFKISMIAALILIGVLAVLIMLIPSAQFEYQWAKLQSQITTNPADRSRNFVTLAEYYEKRGHVDEALAYYEKAAALSTTDHNLAMYCYEHLGDLNYSTGQKHAASEAYAKCLSNAVGLASAGKPDDTDQLYKTAQSALEGYVRAKPFGAAQAQDVCSTAIQLAELYDQWQMSDRARCTFETILPLCRAKRKVNALFGIGKSHLQQGHTKEARNYFDQSLLVEESGDSLALVQNIGSRASNSLNYSLALDYYKEYLNEPGVSRRPLQLFEVNYLIGDCYRHQCNYAMACKHYRNAVNLARKSNAFPEKMPDSLHGLGLSEYFQGNHSAAESALREEVDLRSRFPKTNVEKLAEARRTLGDSLDFQKRHDEATKQYHQALYEINRSSDPDALRSLREEVMQKLSARIPTAKGVSK